MEKIRLIRELKLHDFELYKLREGFYGKVICYMLFIDYKRPSTLKDFPILKNIEDEKTFGRSNYIKVLFISDRELNEEVKDEVISIAGGFFENKDDCDWNCFFQTTNHANFIKLLESKSDLLSFFEEILKELGFCTNLSKIPTEKFYYLSQD